MSLYATILIVILRCQDWRILRPIRDAEFWEILIDIIQRKAAALDLTQPDD